MCVYKNHAFIYFLRPPSWSGKILYCNRLTTPPCSTRTVIILIWKIISPINEQFTRWMKDSKKLDRNSRMCVNKFTGKKVFTEELATETMERLWISSSNCGIKISRLSLYYLSQYESESKRFSQEKIILGLNAKKAALQPNTCVTVKSERRRPRG